MPVSDRKSVKNCLHLGLASESEDRESEIERILALGARRVRVGQTGAESWTGSRRSRGQRVLRGTPEARLIG